MLENTISTKKPRKKRNYYKYNEELKGEGQTEARPFRVSRSDWKWAIKGMIVHLTLVIHAYCKKP